MFQVIDKKTEELIAVYDIKINASGYPTFLICQDNAWIWKSAKHFIPFEYVNTNKQEDNNNYSTFLKMIQNAKIKYRTTDGDVENSLDDNHYIVFEGGFDSTIISAQFNREYKLVDIYFADACQKLEDF